MNIQGYSVISVKTPRKKKKTSKIDVFSAAVLSLADIG